MQVNTNSIDLTGQVAIVTGGGRGLGGDMAQHLATAGAAVALVGRSMEHLADNVEVIAQAGGKAVAFAADVTDWSAIEKTAYEVEAKLGPVDLLVNNAGIVGVPGPLWEADPASWWQVVDVNLRGPFLCTRAVLPRMVQRQRGRIINVASGAALGMIPYGSSYCISKAALARLTESIITDAGEHGVKAFTLDPGPVMTDMSKYLLESEPGKKYVAWYASVFEEGNDFPPEASAQLVTFLASGQGDGLTGCFVSVSDDLSDMLARTKQIQDETLYTLRLKK
jgi:NAD(P)-dependent dehydrogenase (short-subunit alcohol dehydrogenase family)